MLDEVPVLFLLSALSIVLLLLVERGYSQDRRSSNRAILYVRWGLTGWRLAVIVASFLLFEGYGWYRDRGAIHETYVVDDYQLHINSKADPDYDGDVCETLFVSVYHDGEQVVEPVYVGYVNDPEVSFTFTVRRLPEESLIIVVPDVSKPIIVFAYDTATGVVWPFQGNETAEVEEQRRTQLEGRLRHCRGCEQLKLDYLRR